MHVAAAGDIDGDGLGDFALSELQKWVPYEDGTDGAYAGGIYIFTSEVGGEAGGATADQVVSGDTTVPGWDHLGWDLVGAGDLNGDGFDDLLAGAVDGPDFANSSATASLYLIHGPATFASAVQYQAVLGPGVEADQCYGSVVAPVGDVDGDGFPDVSTSCQLIGEVGVYSTALADQVPEDDALATFFGPDTAGGGGRFGHALSGIDVNSDGIGDLSVGAPYCGAVEGAGNLGCVYLFEGPHREATLADDAAAVLRPTVTDSEPTRGYHHLYFGSALATSDLNRDGHEDLIVGAPLTSTDSTGATVTNGAVAIYLGPHGHRTGFGEADAIILGDSSTGGFGGDLDARTDLNLDGMQDLLVGNGYVERYGSESFTMYGSSGGNAHLFFGPTTAGTYLPSDADVRFSFPDDPYFTGAMVETLRDSNGDGWPEVLIGDGTTMVYLFDMPTW